MTLQSQHIEAPEAPVGSRANHHVVRRKLRKRLEAAGVDAAEIERIIDAKRHEQAARRGTLSVPPNLIPKPRPKRKRNDRLRRVHSLARRDGWRCVWCLCPLSEADATLDHVVPKSAGGPDNLNNLVLSCAPCNEDRGGFHGPGGHVPVGTPSRPRRRRS